MGSSFLRVLAGALVALPVALGLFFLMHSLISRDYEQQDIESRRIADIIVPEREIEVRVQEQKPERVDDPEEPPPDLPTPDLDFDMDMNIVNVAPRTQVQVAISSTGMSTGDGEYLPIVRVAPIYPRRAQTRGISGYCIVEFTVTRTGSVRDARAVDCQPAGVFESASIAAAEKFKYRPRIVDGEPIEVGGVQNLFTYELED